MTNLILVVKAILAIQALFDQVLNLIIESQKSADRDELRKAIDQARNAKTREESIGAARKIRDSFRSRGAASAPQIQDPAVHDDGSDSHSNPNGGPK